MKGNHLTKFLFSLLITIVGIINPSRSIAQATTLAAGDIAIIAMGPSSTDQFAFVLLKDINTGTIINFTDLGFASATAGFNGGTGGNAEGFVTYTAPSEQCAGTVITWKNGGSNLSGWSTQSTDFKLNASGEQLFAFQGTGTLATVNFATQSESTGEADWASQTNITVLYGMQTDAIWITTGTTADATSYQPSTSILPAADLIQFTSKSDVVYTAKTFTGTTAAIITSVTTAANFTTSSSQITLPAYTSFIVNPLPPTSGGDVTLTYNGLTHTVSASITGTGLTIDWYNASSSGTLLLSGSTTSPTATAAGTYVYYAQTRSTCNSSNISATRTKITLTINKAALTVTADNKTVNYTDAKPTLTYTITGFVNGENTSVVSGAPVLSTSYTNTTLPSLSPLAISITAGTLAAANYTFSSIVAGTLTINPANIWTGGTNTDWNTSNNWDSKVVPTTNTNIIIASGALHYPLLTTNITIAALSLQTGSYINLGTGAFIINGAISESGTLSGSSTSSLTLNGTAGTINFTTNTDSLLNLSLGSGATATLGSPLYIAAGTNKTPGALTIGSNATLNTTNELTLTSNDSSTAIVAAIPEDALTGIALGTINGTVTVDRYVHSVVNTANSTENGSGNTSVNNGLRAWRLLTVPVTQSGSETIKAAWQNNGIAYNAATPSTQGIGTLITGASATNGLDAVSGTSLLSWNVDGQSFSPVTNTLVPISNGNYGGSNSGNTGYMLFVRGDRNPATVSNPDFGGITINNTMLNPTGNLITGKQVYNVKYSPGTGTGQSRFTLIGNPYAAPVNLATLDTNNVRAQYYIWNPNLNSVGAFVTIDLYFGLTISSPSTGHESQYIQSGQAFFAVGGTEPSDGTLTFNESNKTDSNNNYVFRPAAIPTESFSSSLYLLDDSAITLADGNIVQYRSGLNADIDYLDALKLNNTNETFSLVRDSVKLAIERRPIIANNDTLFFNLAQTTKRNYQFQFTATALNHPGLMGFLKDSYTGDSTMLNLNSNTAVNFSIDANTASQAGNRFMIVFERPAGAAPLPVTFIGIKATQQSNNAIAITWNVQNEINIQSYEVEKSTDGKTYYAIGSVTAIGLSQYNLEDDNAATGVNYYRVHSTGSDGSIQYSQIVQVITGAGDASIAIYPNPVQDAQIGVQFTNMPAGIYIAKLLTTLGQVITTKTINHAGGSATQTIPFNKTLAKGIYQLEIINTVDKSVTTHEVQYQ
jgi:hypothetical protein